MGLADYRRKRRFSKTAEPRGKLNRGKPETAAKPTPATDTKPEEGRRFCIQLHAATRLHFDLRLELDGVLKSWAVPKGVSLDPAEKRLAVHVEDHPLEYATFEGIIPEGNYGAGSVIVWDNGQWEPIGDPHKGYAGGEIKFRLHGHKLQGAWTLVRMRPKPGERGDNWLLIKERDEAVKLSHEADLIRERPESVLSGRTLAEVAAGVEADPPASGKAKKSKSRRGKEKAEPVGAKPRTDGILQHLRATAGAALGPIPSALEPTLGRLCDSPPAGDGWLHEIKFDGYRVLAWLDHGKAKLRTRNGHDWTARFPEIAAAIERLPTNTAILDGEVVALDPNGASRISALQQALSQRGTAGLVFQLFDVLYLEGFDLRPIGLETRKGLLEKLLSRNTDSRLQYVDHVVGHASEFFEHCRRLGLEGMMSKRRDAPYRDGRSDHWLKIKSVQAEPFVIGGYTTPRGASRVKSLMVGYHDEQGRLIYVGHVGSGFSEEMAANLERQLGSIERPKSPFAQAITKESGRDYRWVRPQMVAQLRYAGWTADGMLWHARFEALREDTDPADVVREIPTPAGKIEAPSRGSSREPPPAAPAEKTRQASKPEPLPQKLLDELASVRLTHPEKMLYPDAGLTKLDLVRYYVQIADWILPHVAGRPLSLVRCPDGVQGSQFFQKHAGHETPKTIDRVPIEEGGEKAETLYIRDLKGLASLVQVSVLEIHVWQARVDNPERPDRMVIDLDPDEAVPFSRVIEGALRVRERLTDAGLTSFVKTTGGKGLHVVVPLERRQSWEELKASSKKLAQGMAGDYPQSYTANSSKAVRSGRIYIDWVRNGRGATAVAAYSTRARPGAPVSTPIAWEELTPTLRSDSFTVRNLAERLAGLSADPWGEMGDVRQALTSTVRSKLR